ncbi:MAG TPA: ATPase, T2SS/T4P/T4SS family [Verrucomicrobiae bacterium]|nr:ATPase, T2SS/T4P/T4SS family [Verrucomicrobiae bacterium]
MARAAPLEAREQPLHLRQVLDLLVADGLITAEQARPVAAAPRPERDATHPLVIAARAEWSSAKPPHQKLTVEALVQWLAKNTGLPYLRIDPLAIDVAQATSMLPYHYAARANVLPLRMNAKEATFATADPFMREWERELRPILKRDIKRVLANPLDIRHYLVEFYALANSVKGGEQVHGRTAVAGLTNLEQLTELGKGNPLDANDQHVVGIVDWLLQYAFGQRASDIHLEPRRELNNIRFRIDGVLHDVYQIPAGVGGAVSSRLKILARMDLAEKRRPQDGRIKTRTPDGREVELRVSSLPTAFGEKLVLRIFDPEVLLRDSGQLGLSQSDSARWHAMTHEPHGIVLVTGPTGSGKTTTLYSTLKGIATPEVNVCTIEDPIELIEPAFNQMQVNAAIELNFAAGVRALMRQDPDIIMVGEIRDLETAEIAAQASLTGHLVLSTLHTNDAPSALTRLIDLGVAPYLLRSTLLGVVAQRLVRKLCPHCRETVDLDPKRWREFVAGTAPPPPRQVYEAVGCLECRDTGYKGRVGLYELMPLTRPIKDLLVEGADYRKLREAALRAGMVPLRLAGAEKVIAGLTSLDEVIKATPTGGIGD